MVKNFLLIFVAAIFFWQLSLIEGLRYHSRLRRTGVTVSKRSKDQIAQTQARYSLFMTNDNKNNDASNDDPEDAVKKYGLEAGLIQAATSKESKLKPKDLLAKYGVAYLVTSITLAIFSYTFFYFLVANGVDVASLLEKVGISSTTAATSTGTAAIAYALHKAASPIRFPPTVLLTPIVANILGKKPKSTND
jgi:hypothetical protein